MSEIVKRLIDKDGNVIIPITKADNVETTDKSNVQAKLNQLNNRLTSVNTDITNINGKIDQKSAAIDEQLTSLDDKIDRQVDAINNSITQKETALNNTIAQKENAVNQKIDGVKQDISGLSAHVDNEVSRIDQTMESFSSSIDDLDAKVDREVETLNSTITEAVNDLNTAIDEKAAELTERIDGVSASVDDLEEKVDELIEHPEFELGDRIAKGTGELSILLGNISENNASGMNSIAEGNATIASNKSQHVFGEFNDPDPSENSANIRGEYVEIVGNGTADDARSNARTLDWSGNETLAGKLTVGADPTENMDVTTKQYVDNGLSTKANASDLAAKANASDLTLKVDKPTASPNGTSGQFLKTNGDGTTTWADVSTATDAQVENAVGDWLTGHPEATTTVQDGAITKAKLDSNLQLKVDDVDNLKSEINTFVLPNYELITPTNWHNTETDTVGYTLKANGDTVEASDRFYTDFIPVKKDDLVYQYYFSGDTRMSQYRRNVCCFNSSKQVVSGGNNSVADGSFTVPDGVAYVRITFATSGRSNIVITVNTIPNTKPSYFEPYYELSHDMLTPESETEVERLKGKKYGCALPKSYLKMTNGISETWYKINIATPPTDFIDVSIGDEYTQRKNDRFVFPNTRTLNSGLGYYWTHYDETLQVISNQEGDAQYGQGRYIGAENLASCSVLAIGDSTVDQDVMTQKLLDYFTSKSVTLTLLGTLGRGDNKNEGRAGWKAADYLTDKQYNGVTNPFYNPTSETFDFSYYMTNQDYTAPTFVVIQLGINDLYYTYDSAIETTWTAIKTMIDSIMAYNTANSTSIKVLLNLPTPPNTDQSKMHNIGFLYRNAVIRYNEYAIAQAKSLYGNTKVRPTYCHLILDPSTEIRDDVHPTDTGYEKMAMEVINQINCWQNGH